MAAVPTPLPPADDAPHLLVVDDDRRIRDLLSRFLTTEGYRISTADSATEARAKLSGLSFDLIVLDTPPASSALAFLDAPKRVLEFVDGRVLRYFGTASAIGAVGCQKQHASCTANSLM